MEEIGRFLMILLKETDKKEWTDKDIKRYYNNFLKILKSFNIDEKDALDTGAQYIKYNSDYDFSNNANIKEYIARIFDCMESLKTYQMFLIIGVILKVNSNKNDLLDYNEVKKGGNK